MSDLWHETVARATARCHESIEAAIRVVAEAQSGVISREQLQLLGLSEAAIRQRVAKGYLVRLHRGVYALGHSRLTRHGRWIAAILACGPDAVLSHRDAAALHGIRNDNRSRIEVTTPTHRIGPSSVIVHRARLPDDERTVLHGIPVTSLFRTFLDLSRVVRDEQLRKAMNEAERQQLGDTLTLASFLKRHERHPGVQKLRSITPTTRLTRSQLEDAFLTYCTEHRLPHPQTNTTAAGYEIDALWPEHGLVAELDGYEFHHTRIDIADDNTKAQDLQAAGLTVARINGEHLASPRLAHRLRAMMRR